MTTQRQLSHGLRFTATLLLVAMIPHGGASFGQPPIAADPALPPNAFAVNPSQQAMFAILGSPFGVAKIEIPVGTPTAQGQLDSVEVWNDEGRIFYPTTREIVSDPKANPPRATPAPGEPRIGGGRLIRRVGDLVRQATASDETPKVVSREVLFLFRGDEPLRVRIDTPDAAGRTEFLLTPSALPSDEFGVDEPGAGEHRIAMNRWWSSYGAEMQRLSDAGDYPAIVESYLVALLAGRLGLELPAKFLVDAIDSDPTLVSTLSLIAGTEKIRSTIFRRAALGSPEPGLIANLPLPNEPRWAPAIPPQTGAVVEIEPMAAHVPPECFYIRYGSFENYLWFRDLSEEYGGDIGRMVALRGSNDGSAQRVEQQLSLKMTALSRMLGGTVIEDQAIVGRDLFLSEGASIGVMIRAKNALLLQTSLNSDRSSTAKSDPDVKLTNEKILGRDVTFLHTIDNRVRSFMVVDGETIFVTNSRTLVKRFLEVAADGQSLATTPEFMLARQLMPVSRGDSIFAYFSPAMLHGLVAPSYLIEMRRRLYASADMSLIKLARLAAAAEGEPLDEPEDLIAAGYLPRDFGQRSDGSGVLAIGNEIVDSLRGRPGTLLPIADVTIDQVTAGERDWYGQIAAFHETKWQQIDPIFVGVRRTEVANTPSIQRLEIHAEIAPLVAEKYGEIAKQLGPPTRVKIDFAPDDIVAAQAHVVSDQLGGSIPPHHLFAAIKDTVPPSPEQFSGILQTYQALRALPGYLGAWPQPGLLDRLPLGLGRGQPIGPGLTKLIGGVYRYQGGGFSIVSLQSDVLLASLPFLAATESDSVAQVRARVGNLRGSRLEGWVNAQVYDRSAVASRAGARMLGLLSQQLKVPMKDANEVAGQLLGGRLQDPLGGQYVLANAGGAEVSSRWISDASLNLDRSLPLGQVVGGPETPPGYVAPILSWFRGGQAELTQYPDRLVTDVVIDVERGRPQPATP